MITGIVLTKNEEKNIGNCLKSLLWCDEIIVIDDESEDKTVEIAKKAGAKVFERKLGGDFSDQRNFGLEKARGDWILFVDADEIISDKLSDEILRTVCGSDSGQAKMTNSVEMTSASRHSGESATPESNGFYIKRQDFWGGRMLKHGETGNTWLLRLAKKNSGKWKRAVHETWDVEGKIGKLKNPILHYPHPTLTQFLTDVNAYSTIHAQELIREGKKSNLFKIIFYPLAKFKVNYFVKLGFLDGTPGMVHALMMSLHSFLSWGKAYASHLKVQSPSFAKSFGRAQ